MIDNLNPTNQFHPYQPVRDTPQIDKPKRGFRMLARDLARSKPALALGALAFIAIAIGLMRGRG